MHKTMSTRTIGYIHSLPPEPRPLRLMLRRLDLEGPLTAQPLSSLWLRRRSAHHSLPPFSNLSRIDRRRPFGDIRHRYSRPANLSNFVSRIAVVRNPCGFAWRYARAGAFGYPAVRLPMRIVLKSPYWRQSSGDPAR